MVCLGHTVIKLSPVKIILNSALSIKAEGQIFVKPILIFDACQMGNSFSQSSGMNCFH